MRLTYKVQKGENPADVAEKYTGNRDLYTDLVSLNPHIEETVGAIGAPAFSKSAWRDGMRINIPQTWAARGPIYPVTKPNYAEASVINTNVTGLGDPLEGWDPQGPSSGGSGTKQSSSCTPYGVVITDVKPYWYIIQPEDISDFWLIPKKFGLPTGSGESMTWFQLRNANFDWPGGFVRNSSGACQMQGLFTGAKIHVPANWPEPNPGVTIQPKKGEDPREKDPLGKDYTTPGGLDPVSHREGDTNTIWILLAVGAAVAGGIYMYSARDSKRK